MLTLKATNRFDKELIQAVKASKDITKIREVIKKLVNREPLERKYKDHKLKGKFKNRRECHIGQKRDGAYKRINSAKTPNIRLSTARRKLFSF